MESAAFKFIADDRAIAIAYRGGASVHPENSMAAYAHAVSLGYRFVKTDVQATSDGVALAFQDPELDNATDRSGNIGELDWSEVRQAKLWNGETPAPLVDLLSGWPGVAFALEPADDNAIEAMLPAIRRTGAWNRVCIASLSGQRLALARRLSEKPICTTFAKAEIFRLPLAAYGIPVGDFESPLLQTPLRFGAVKIVDRFLVNCAHRRRLRIHAQVINQEDKMVELLDLGVDGIVSEQTALLKQVFVRRGIWR
jgi:glycerophosphoryl diester phosphodiesterase